MILLLPLGLLGLIAVIGLILIYVLKPNYQQKLITSTYVWKLSLKYKKRRVPVSRLRNIILFLCQLFALILCALLLAKPVLPGENAATVQEKIVILDASASMRMAQDDETRFERAVSQIRTLARKTAGDNGLFTLILADKNPEFLVQRATAKQLGDTEAVIEELVDPTGMQCSYESADVEAAIDLANTLVVSNPDAEVLFYTATTYIDKGGVNVVNVADENDWNAAVLDAKAVIDPDNNFYTIQTRIGCYGHVEILTVTCEIFTPNDIPNHSFTISKSEAFNLEETEREIIFDAEEIKGELGDFMYRYGQIHVYVEANDSFEEDNHFYIYGGIKQQMRIQYVSENPNPFFQRMIMTFRSRMTDFWDIEYKEVDSSPNDAKYEDTGFDLYIFEHKMPSRLPRDGAVLLVDPSTAPRDAGFTVAGEVSVNKQSVLSAGVSHPLVSGVDPQAITISKYRKLTGFSSYEELLTFNGDPIVMASTDSESRVVVWALDVHYSNLPILFVDFTMLFYNVLDYYLPRTFVKLAYDVGETATIRARGKDFVASVPGEDDEILTEFPYSLKLNVPGTYTFTQTDPKGETISESFYVTVPDYESNITKQVDALARIQVRKKTNDLPEDLLVFFAAALLLLLFIEWWLQSREYF